MDLLLPICLLVLGYIIGGMLERRHFRSLKARELRFLVLPAVTFRNMPGHETAKGELVMGSAVISVDYFKRFLAILRNIFGGRVSSYESLVDRARREAILRMKEQASRMGADIIVNMRIETSAIGNAANSRRSVGSVEAIAYGTALVPKRAEISGAASEI
ncbi:MAG: YbjQ family protein [Thermodesulfobacteria bacterium]|nr:YbjQ family protein [Thermodesulfobacteriota bacterium]